jgi:hypothetical protein
MQFGKYMRNAKELNYICKKLHDISLIRPDLGHS